MAKASKSATRTARATRTTARAARGPSKRQARAAERAAAAAGEGEQAPLEGSAPGDVQVTTRTDEPSLKGEAARTRQLEAQQNAAAKSGKAVRDAEATRLRLQNEERNEAAQRNVKAMDEKNRRAERDAKEQAERAKSEQEAIAKSFEDRKKAEAELERSNVEAARMRAKLAEMEKKIDDLAARADRPRPNRAEFSITAKQLDPAKVRDRQERQLKLLNAGGPRMMADPLNPAGPMIPAPMAVRSLEPIGKSFKVVPVGPSSEKGLPVITVHNAADESDAKCAYCLHLQLPGETLSARVEPADVSDPAAV